jgi:hypothetical protein
MTDEPDKAGKAEEGGSEMTRAKLSEQLGRLIVRLKFWILKRISMRAKVNP